MDGDPAKRMRAAAESREPLDGVRAFAQDAARIVGRRPLRRPTI